MLDSALNLVLTVDPALIAIVRLSLLVSLSAVFFAALIGMPLGALIALSRFPGREASIVLLNALMGLPPVVVGLAVYLLLSRSGPLGAYGLLFTPTAMVIAQTILVAPIIAALTRQTIEDLWIEYRDELTAMNLGPLGRVMALIWDARFSLVTALLAGFGRAAAEVGAIIIVGGNIEGFTRTMTTAIALETSKGDLPLAVGLGTVLIAIVVVVNAGAWGLAGERGSDPARDRVPATGDAPSPHGGQHPLRTRRCRRPARCARCAPARTCRTSRSRRPGSPAGTKAFRRRAAAAGAGARPCQGAGRSLSGRADRQP